MAGGQGLMAGKRGLILGVANNRSIAWGIAKACADQGAELSLTYQGEAFKKRVEPLAAELGAHIAGHCDVTDVASVDAVFAAVSKHWDRLDFLVHAIAFSDKEELTGRYIETSRENFLRTMDISVYSFTTIAKRAEPLMTNGGSMLTLTYYGAEKVMPHYNVMGVAKAALEASVRLGHRRFPPHPEMERIQCAVEAHGYSRGSGRVRHVLPVRPVAGRHR
jgi:enoyl-[acyl-carrier protein] reductase I